MAKARKKSHGRAHTKRSTSAPPPPAPVTMGETPKPPAQPALKAAPAPLRVEPLPPPPSFEAAEVADEAHEPSSPPPELVSLAPVTYDDEAEPVAEPTRPEPARRRVRSIAYGAIAVFAFAAVGVGVNATRRAHARPAARALVTSTVATTAEPPREAPPPAPVAAPAPAPEASAAPSAPTPTVAEQAAPPPPAAAAGDHVATAKELRDQALDLLKQSKNPEAMVAATNALEADPTDAMPYLVLGSALQDAGRWREAHHAYEACVKTAKKGMVDECRAMLRRR